MVRMSLVLVLSLGSFRAMATSEGRTETMAADLAATTPLTLLDVALVRDVKCDACDKWVSNDDFNSKHGSSGGYVNCGHCKSKPVFACVPESGRNRCSDCYSVRCSDCKSNTDNCPFRKKG